MTQLLNNNNNNTELCQNNTIFKTQTKKYFLILNLFY